MSDLIDTTEMYLRTIFELEEEGVVPMRARIAERLGHSGPTVSQTVARMERDGLLHVSGDRHLELTDAGRVKATRVMRKHRLAERLLLDVIGLEWELVHEEACRWEHVMSDHVERKLLALLPEPFESPYGNPIPGLAELGDERAGAGESVRARVVALPVALGPEHGADGGSAGEVTAESTAESTAEFTLEFTVRRLGEPLQGDRDLLGRLLAARCMPSRRVAARRNGATIRVRGEGGTVELTALDAQHVFVDAP